MLVPSMDQMNYYTIPKDAYLELDPSLHGVYGMPTQLSGDEGSPTYLNDESSPKNGTKSSLYKTELCKRYSEFGNCRYGAKCQFAHGLGELRHVVRHPKYKTTKCKSYWGSGHCPYGSRCRFIHEEVEGFAPPSFNGDGTIGVMGGMFMRDKALGPNLEGSISMQELGSPSAASYHHNSMGFNDHNLNGDPHHLGGASTGLPYIKEYSLSPPFHDQSWAPNSTQQKMSAGYGGDHFSGGSSSLPRTMYSHSTLGAGSIGSSLSRYPAPSPTHARASTSSPNYPDLQDAIDALVNFSLTSQENEPSGAGTISTTPSDAVAAAVTPDPRAKKTDYSLESDELWKDFPATRRSSVVEFSAENLSPISHEMQWPAGLVLNLEGKTSSDCNSSSGASSPGGADNNDSDTTISQPSPEDLTTKETTLSKDEEEKNPRLSVFVRFH